MDLDLSFISLSDEELEAMEEVEEHRALQEMFGQEEVVHVENLFFSVSWRFPWSR